MKVTKRLMILLTGPVMVTAVALPTMAASSAVTPPGPPSRMAPPTVSMVAATGEVDISWTAPRSDGGLPIQGYQVTVYDATNGSAIYGIGTDAATFSAVMDQYARQNGAHNISVQGPAHMKGVYSFSVASYNDPASATGWSAESGVSRKVVLTQDLAVSPVQVSLPNSKASAHTAYSQVTVRNTGNQPETVNMGSVGAFSPVPAKGIIAASLYQSYDVTLAPGQTSTVWNVRVDASGVASRQYGARLQVVESGSSDMAGSGTLLANPWIAAIVLR
jgi:hypothetical protein